MIIAGFFRWSGLAFAAAEVATAAETTAAITACCNAAHDKDCLAPSASDDEVRVHILLTELLPDVQTQRAIIVVNVALSRIV